MAQDSGEIVVAKQANVYIGPVGTVVEDNPTTALAAGFVELGYTTEDGVTFSASVDVEDIRAHQSSTPVRRIVTGRGVMASFSLEQWNRDNFALGFGGGTWTQVTAPVTTAPTSPGVYEFLPPSDDDDLAEYALVLDFQDGSRASRVEIHRGNVSDSVETTLTPTGAALLPITFTGLTPDGQDRAWRYLSNDDAALAAA